MYIFKIATKPKGFIEAGGTLNAKKKMTNLFSKRFPVFFAQLFKRTNFISTMKLRTIFFYDLVPKVFFFLSAGIRRVIYKEDTRLSCHSFLFAFSMLVFFFFFYSQTVLETATHLINHTVYCSTIIAMGVYKFNHKTRQ